MATPKAPTQTRGSLSDIKDLIRRNVAIINDAKGERENHNADIAAAYAAMEAKGIAREAVKMAAKYLSWDEDKRAGFDTAYAIVRETMGVPFEEGLFDAEGNPNVEKIVAKPEKKKDVKPPESEAPLPLN